MTKHPVTRRKALPPKRTPWPLYMGAAALVIIVAGVFLLARPGNDNAPAAAGSGSAATAQLSVDQDKIDFGDVPVDQVVKATFVLKNTGGEDLQILSEPQVRVVEGC